VSAAPVHVLERTAARAGTVLVVDDDDAMRETAVEILAATGLQAEGAASAAAAQTLQTTLQPEVALVDQRLPDSTGVELGTTLKQRDDDMTVLLVTGYASLENAIAAVWQFDGYLTKPVPPAELVRVVRSGLEHAGLRRENRSLVEELRRANALLEESVAERTKELQALVGLAERLAGAGDLDAVVAACLETVASVTKARYSGLYLADESGDAAADLRLRGAVGDRPLAEVLRTWARPSGTVCADVVSTEDVVSLAAGGHAVGALVIGGAVRRQPIFLSTLAASTAVAIQNAQRLGRERETVERLSELARMKTTFLAAVSHELRTPLAVILGLSELLASRIDRLAPARTSEMAAQILDQGHRLGGLIDDLLDATRIESGGLRVHLDEVDVAAVLERVERSFQATGSPVVVRVEDGLPAVRGDAGRLEQVISNLVTNGFKHSAPGTRVEVDACTDGDRVRIAVTDTGTGIETELLEHLFEPFTQGAGVAARRDGLGLGLYIVRGLLDRMGGSIEAESTVGEGSRFTVLLERA
jgi:two-component system, OmpR family, phosphate regulon sensor histidine kinase PhoR